MEYVVTSVVLPWYAVSLAGGNVVGFGVRWLVQQVVQLVRCGVEIAEFRTDLLLYRAGEGVPLLIGEVGCGGRHGFGHDVGESIRQDVVLDALKVLENGFELFAIFLE